MQDVIEVVRVTKNAEIGYIDKVKKIIEWRDVISIEEAGQEIGSELESDNLVMITLSYAEIVVDGDYEDLKAKWMKYRKAAKKEKNNGFNLGTIN